MHATDIIAWHYCGAVYCPDCKPTGEGEGGPSPVFADQAEGERGATCDDCGACFVDCEWLTHSDATNDKVTRWAICEACNHHAPHRSDWGGDYKEARRRYAKLGAKACPNCLRGRMKWK